MKHRATLAALGALLLSGRSLADFTWDGDGGDDLMTNGANWIGGTEPDANVGGETLIFDVSLGSLTPDVAARDYTDVGGLSFGAGAGAYVIEDANMLGGSFSFLADSGFIQNDSGNLQQINVDLIGIGSGLRITAAASDIEIGGAIDLSDTGGVLLTVDGAAGTTLGGAITGPGASILKTGAGTLTLGGENTFTGGVELREGTLVLGDNDALGTGTLSVTGDASLQSDDDSRNVSEAVSISDMTTLTVSGANDLRYTGIMSGAGALRVDMGDPAKTLTLNGPNTYTGGTTLNSGRVLLGSNSSFGAGLVSVTDDFTIESNLDDRRISNDIDIAADKTLDFEGQSLIQQFASEISGGGSLRINLATGSDEIELRGSNTYTGGTFLTQGTIVLADNDSLGDGALTLEGDGAIRSTADNRIIANDIDNGGFTLTFGGTNDLKITGKLDGTGGLTLDAQATLTLTANSTISGLTQINTGSHLFLDSGTVRGAVEVNDGGLLSGDGRILGVGSDLTLRTGGMLTPGESVGTIEVGGDYLQETGSTYVVELDADTGLADLLDITGSATLQAGSTVEATLMGTGYIASGQSFTVIEADGGVTDLGTQLMTDSATVTITLAPDVGANTWGIQALRAADAYSAATMGDNNLAIGLGLDSTVPIADADTTGPAAQLLGQLDALDAESYNQAVAALTPEPFNITNATSVENIRDFTLEQAAYLAAHREGFEMAPTPFPGPPPGSMVLAEDDPLLLAAAIAQADGPAPQAAAEDEDPRWGRYFKVQGVFADQDTTATRSGFDATAFGAQIGLDYAYTPNFVLGVALGYVYTDADLKLDLGNIQGQTVRAGPYMSVYEGNWYLDGSATFGWSWFDSDRTNTTLGQTAHANYTGWDVTGYVGTGYRFDIDHNLAVTPIASALYSHFDYESFTETGGGGMALTLPSRTSDSLRSRLGASLSYRIPNLKFRPVPYVYSGWEHEFLDDDNVEAAFASGGNPFIVDVGSRTKDAFFIGGGVNVLVNRNISAFVRIEGLTANNTNRVGAAAGFSVQF